MGIDVLDSNAAQVRVFTAVIALRVSGAMMVSASPILGLLDRQRGWGICVANVSPC